MQKKLKHSFLLVLLALLLSLNGSQQLNNTYITAYKQDNVYYVAKQNTQAVSPPKVLGSYSGNQPVPIVNPFQVYSHDQMIKDSEALKKLYPSIIKTETLGYTSGGRSILLIKLGNGKKKITLNGSHHAREYISTTLLMKMIEEYSYSYKNHVPFKGFDVNKLLDEVTIYFVPMVNPDGVTLVQSGAEKLTNSKEVMKINGSKISFKSWKANGMGVDLNYQYPYGWSQIRKLDGPSSEGFKGFKPATEPETRIMMKFTMDNPFLVHVAYHTQGEIMYWYNGQTGDLYNRSLKIGRNLSRLTGYRLLRESEQKISFGGYKDWTVTTFKKPGFTIELCPYMGNFPYPDKNFNDVWNKAGASGLLLAQEAAEMVGYDFEVLSGGKVIQVFNSKEDAVGFAKQYVADEVIRLGTSIWHK